MPMPSLLDRLDEIARDSELPPECDAGALDCMEAYAQSAPDLRHLIDRYGTSSSSNLVAALAFLLSRRAASVTEESCGLVYVLIERIGTRRQPQVLQNCLAAIHRQLIAGRPWPAHQAAPELLGRFVLNCLRLTGPQAWLVLSSAADLLEGLAAHALLDKVIGRSERDEARALLWGLATNGDPAIREDAERALAALASP